MDEMQRIKLAEILRVARARKGWSARETARQAGVDVGMVLGLERYEFAKPGMETIRAIAQALDLLLSDLFAEMHWLEADELPTLRPYMRAKYGELTDSDLTRVEALVSQLRARPNRGPQDHEDEQ